MWNNNLHVICFDIPYPANYGGAIEEFYKLITLSQLGVKIHLHCFEYGNRTKQDFLKQYCENVYYYKRHRDLKSIFTNIPFIVKTRMDNQLLQNLLSNDYPILFDATQTTGFLQHPLLRNRKKIVRLHNIEWIYYRILFDSAVTLTDKIFYFQEYKKLRNYDKILVNADVLSCLSQTDFEYYTNKFPQKKVSLEYVFHENEKVVSLIGKGNYIIYQGNLSLMDNYQLILSFLNNELKNCTHKIILAGKDPHPSILELQKYRTNITVVANPTNAEMLQLLQQAHICLALAKNPSGVKLKLINALFCTRFVVANENALNGSGLDELCEIIDSTTDCASKINTIMQQTFDEEQIKKRKAILENNYNNLQNAKLLINHIFKQ